MVWRGPTQRCSSLSAGFHPVAKSRWISWPNSLRSSATGSEDSEQKGESASATEGPRIPFDIETFVPRFIMSVICGQGRVLDIEDGQVVARDADNGSSIL